MRTCHFLLTLFATPTLYPALAQKGAEASVLGRHALRSAVCADGSAGVFYMAANSSSNDYIFRFMGGAGCAYNETKCDEVRVVSPSLVTSDGWPEAARGYGLLSGDAAENPLYSTYNRVFVPYCTQDMHLMDTESSNGELQFRGRPYLEETVKSVLGNSSREATVVLLGSSSGGIGAMNAVSWLLDTFDQVAELSVILDSAFFVDIDGTLAFWMDYMRENQLAAYSPRCSEDFDGGPCCLQIDCLIQRGYFPVEDERLKGTMLLSPVQDVLPVLVDTPESVAIAHADDDVEVTFTTVWDAATYIGRGASLLRRIALNHPAAISVFAPSCMDHGIFVSTSVELWMCSFGYLDVDTKFYDEKICKFFGEGDNQHEPLTVTYVRSLESVGLRLWGSQSAEAWENLQIGGMSMRTATEEWWEGRGDASKQVFMFDACDDLNCNPTCLSGFLPGTRDESDSLLVWLMVLSTLTAALLVLAAGVSALVWGLLQEKRAKVLLAPGLVPNGTIDGIKNSPSSQGDRPLRTTAIAGAEHIIGGGHSEAKPVLEWRALCYWLPATQPRFFSRSPLTLSSNEGGATTDTPHQEKQLLHFVNGTVPEGALCALMGPSGSGKSTLLDLLSGRKNYGRCEGRVLFKGSSIADQQKAYISQSGYMRQVDTGYLEGLTVLENLIYAAMLRCPGTIEDQSTRVRRAIEQSSLERTEHTKAGGLSGGEKRRLKVALELLMDRQILFLDEPTSGLDANSSLELVTILKRLSRKVTLVVSIHQPRPEVWQLFSHAILLTAGRAVYCGSADNALAGVTSVRPQQWDHIYEDGGRALNSAGRFGMDQKNPIVLVRDPTKAGGDGHPDQTPAGRSIPDTILDRLVQIGIEQPQDGEETARDPCRNGGDRGECAASTESGSSCSRSLNASESQEETADSAVPTAMSRGGERRGDIQRRTSVFKAAAVLFTRSWKNGYARDLVLSSAVLVTAVTFIIFSIRMSSPETRMLHLVFSVLLVSVLPVLLVYTPVMLVRSYDEWPLAKLEIADGFYTQWCATIRYVIDQFAAAVLLSLVVVSIAYASFWGGFVPALPTSGPAVFLQLLYATTLTGWTTISLFSSLLISGLSFGVGSGISNACNTIWGVFSGVLFVVNSIPFVLKAVTYSSPHYWTTFFGLRVLLDGLDMSASCEYDTQAYCATGYGDLVANALDLHVHTTGQGAVCLVVMASTGLVCLIAMVHFRGRHVPIVGEAQRP